MADTGEDREIKQRSKAHQAETVRESKTLAQKLKGPSVKSAARNTNKDRGNRKSDFVPEE